MKLNEIIEEIDLLVPNAFSAARKIRWMNQSQRQLFHDYPTFLVKKEIPLSRGSDTVPLPADCQQAKIDSVIVGEWEYVFSGDQERPEYRTYTMLDNQLKLYPAASENTILSLYYKPTPVDLTDADLNSTPPFPEDFHELLIYGGAYRTAQRVQDYALAGELEIRYMNLSREAAKRITKPKRKTTVVSRGWY